MALKGRDAIAKQALIDYLNEDTDERFWQAIGNFGEMTGLCKHFLLTSATGDRKTATDLFFQESDDILRQNIRDNKERAKREQEAARATEEV